MLLIIQPRLKSYLDPQAPRKSLTIVPQLYAMDVDNLDPQAPRKSLTVRFVINHSKCNKKHYLHFIIYCAFAENCYIMSKNTIMWREPSWKIM